MLQRLFIGLFLVCGLSIQAQAGVGALFGLSFNFGTNISISDFGLTVKVLSDNEEDKFVAAAGVSYFPFAEQGNMFGADLSGGYIFENAAVTLGWDFLNRKPQLALGYVNSQDDSNSTPQITPPPVDNPTPPEEDVGFIFEPLD